jgi:c-di-GMP-binding flagellar brake protein YcgR
MEERKCKRIAAGIGCWLVEGDNSACLTTFDISAGGMAAATSLPLAIGKVVTLQFFTPRSAKTLDVEAEVLWDQHTEDGGMTGFRFINVDHATLAQLQELALLCRSRWPRTRD